MLSWGQPSQLGSLQLPVDAQTCQHSHFYCVLLIATAREGVGAICTKAAILRNAAVPELGQGGTGEQIVQCSVCTAQGTDAPDIDQNALEFSTCAQSNGLGYTDGQWGLGEDTVGDLCCMCWSVHSPLGPAFPKGQKKWFQMGIIAHIFPITGILEVLLVTDLSS